MKTYLLAIVVIGLSWTRCGTGAADVRTGPLSRVAALTGTSQRSVLLAFLEQNRQHESWYRESLLYHEARLRPALRPLLQEPKFAKAARVLLALIGDPEDLRLILRTAPPCRSDGNDRWAYAVACALLEPRSEQEWGFLREAALNEYNDRWVDAGAIQTLKLIASPRSREILEEVRRLNRARAKSANQAIEYIDSKPVPLVDPSLERLSGRVARNIAIGRVMRIEPPIYSQAGDKAVAEFTFIAASDQWTYLATFHRVGGVWRFRGARETLHAFAPPLGVVVPHRRSIPLPEPPVLPSDPVSWRPPPR
jgi:hypothetical protein